MANVSTFPFHGTLEAINIVNVAADSDQDHNICIDLQCVRFAKPCGIATLAAWIDRILSDGRQVSVIPPTSPDVFQYLQNMNFFRIFNINEHECFNRHDQKGRFSRMTRIHWDADVDSLATQLTETIRKGNDAIRNDLLTCLAESLSNLQSHARSSGYCISQSFKRGSLDEYYEMAICDGGMGIASSLRDNADLQVQNDQHALEIACQRGISRVNQNDPNKQHFGMGLFQIDRITRSTEASFDLLSGGYMRCRNKEHLVYQPIKYWTGTVLKLMIPLAGCVNRP